ncbi:MAG: GNAT family N-acetyltransferase [Anaerolineales bacterium]|uniref:GNAT family N-acetyltransferase n=1 Tax=Promineifilum sp. TaxID=2664178 RepID=UPI001DDA2EFC|nr:GNAT family N-acetyltransferase [Anaerolineales bacterium]MCO5178528.1 GNAT family N-acetyltransferase [Promineifilum sp.]
MRSELIVGDGAFNTLAGEWDALAQTGMTDTPFQILAYQKAWWQHLQPDGAELITIATRNGGDELVGIGCFFLLDGRLHFNGCVEETDYLDLIAPVEQAQAVWQSTLQHLEATSDLTWNVLDLCNIPQDSPSLTILPALASQFNYKFDSAIAEVCPVITLPESFGSYLESLESKQRRELSRKLRKAEAAEVTSCVVGASETIEQEVDSFLELLQKSTFEKHNWLDEHRRALFHDVAREAHKAGTLQLMFTEIAGQRAAALFNFDYKNRIWVYNSGLDPTAFTALSPGVVLTAAAIEKAIELGRETFDFLRGDEEYKYRFGAVDTKVYRVLIERAG